MKKLLLVAFVACLSVFATSCSKEKDLVGTSWVYSLTQSADYSGITIDVEASLTLAFTDETNGKLDMSVVASSAGTVLENQSESYDITYTFDGTNGTITYEGESMDFVYNEDDNTISMTMVDTDEETGETTTETYVFTEKK